MVHQITSYLIEGIIHLNHSMTLDGRLWLCGLERDVSLFLTGEIPDHLKGQSFRVRPPLSAEFVEAPDEIRNELLTTQVGALLEVSISHPSGTPCHDLDTSDNNELEFHLRWHGQNGPVAIHISGVILERANSQDHDTSEVDEMGVYAGTEFIDRVYESVTNDEFTTPEIPSDLFQSTNESREFLLSFPTPNEKGTFPPDAGLIRYPLIHDITGADRTTNGFFKFLDEISSGQHDVFLADLLDPPLRLPPSNVMSDDEISIKIAEVLARIAKHGVAVSVCDHFGPRDLYDMFCSQYLPETRIHPQLIEFEYIFYIDTFESCPMCQASLEVG
jgi:hypothetical protein